MLTKLHKEFNTIKDSETGWECYTTTGCVKLFYFVHRKCASSTYIDFFKKLNWESANTTMIDWENDIVFSHIKDPLVKHRKGIVEACAKTGTIDVILKNTVLIPLISHSTSFDNHSFSIERMLGKHATQVHWIPLDTDVDHKRATMDFINQHGIEIPNSVETWFLTSNPANLSNDQEKKLYNLLMSCPTPPDILRYIDFDVCLYDQIITPPPHVVAETYYKTRIEELLNSGLSQQQAEEIVDKEVYDETIIRK